MTKKICVLFFSLCFSFMYAQNVDDVSQENVEKEVVLDDVQEKKAIILYGLESELINLIKELKEKEDDRFNNELVDSFSKAKSIALKTTIIDFFASRKLNSLDNFVLEILENLDDYKTSEINASLYYAGENALKDSIPHIISIIENDRFEFAEGAIKALGKIGGDSEALALVDFYQNTVAMVDDDKKEVILKEAIMQALENIAFGECLNFLIEVVEDENENVMVRALAISALSKIETEEVFKKLLSLYYSQEALIRASSVKAISKFNSDEARKLLVQACKDSQYKVRKEAIDAINFTSDDVYECLLYRAKMDPEMSIRMLSIEKLVSLNATIADDWLLKTFNDDSANVQLRVKIAKELLKDRLDFIIKDVEKVAIKAVSSNTEKKLAYELGRVIAKVKTDSTAKIAESYIKSKDVLIKTLGLDMFSLNKYPSIIPLVEEIKNDSKAGALQKRAISLLKE